MAKSQLKAPFPYFGGKSKVAPLIWERFGKVDNFVEGFFGSGAVLLGCPSPGHTETVNDADGLLCNFWRALQADPDAVARAADYPVSELDLHARHRWLVARRVEVERLLEDPDYYDAQAAGWWVWGISQWIGSGWCPREGARGRTKDGGVWKQGPYLSRPGSGLQTFGQLPMLQGDSGASGCGVHRKSFGQIPAISPQDGGGERTQGIFRERDSLLSYLQSLSIRLRRVRVTCGDFERILGPSVTWRHGLTAVFLDPPYDRTERAEVYAVESDTAQRARAWALNNGDNKLLRIAYCGYDTGETWPEGWELVRWKATGGYGSQGEGRGRANAERELIAFSPHCLKLNALPLFAHLGAPHAP